MDYALWKSIDGGKTFVEVATPHGDNHDLWIDPADPRRMIEGNDGGACVSFNGGQSWSTIYNQPTAQFYHVCADDQQPYRVYGSQQDNWAISLPSQSHRGAITAIDWLQPGGGESGYIAVKPGDPAIVVGGSIGSGPGHGAPHPLRPPDRAGADHQRLAREVRHGRRRPPSTATGSSGRSPSSTRAGTRASCGSPATASSAPSDEGQSWEIVSPDLTRNDPAKLGPSGGPITRDNTGAEVYCTIFALVESAARARRAVGRHRRRPRPSLARPRPDLAAGDAAGASRVGAGQRAGALTARRRHLLPGGHALQARRHPALPLQDERLRAHVDAHHRRPAGGRDHARASARTRAGAASSTAAPRPASGCRSTTAARGSGCAANLPVAPIHDLIVKDGDLVVATHGRSFWILDDLTPLHQMADAVAASDAHLFAPRRSMRWRAYRGHGVKPGPNREIAYRMVGSRRLRPIGRSSRRRGRRRSGCSTPARTLRTGSVVHYWLREAPPGDLTLAFLDADGREIRSFTSRPRRSPAPDGAPARIARTCRPAGKSRAHGAPDGRRRRRAAADEECRRQPLRLEPAGS